MTLDHPDEIGSLAVASSCGGGSFSLGSFACHWSLDTRHRSHERLFYPFGEFWQGSLGMHQTFGQLPDYDNDSNSDLYNTLNRHYTPMGRWLSPDPGGLEAVNLDDPQTWNMYAYVRNNPTTLTDPTGLQSNSPGDPRNCSVSGEAPCLADVWARSGGLDKPATQQTSPAQMTSLQFLGQELVGVWDATGGVALGLGAALLNGQAEENIATTAEWAVSSPGKIGGAIKEASLGAAQTVESAASLNPRAIGQVAGVIIATAAGVKGEQAAAEEAQGLRGIVNKVRTGPREGEIQHLGVVNNKGNLIHVGRQGTDWHLGVGRGGGASGAGAAIHIPIPKWISSLWE
jgi:RHS repeat-associated protein